MVCNREKKPFVVPQEKSKKRIASQRRKKASIETLADGGSGENSTEAKQENPIPELEVNVITRTRRSSSASRTKRPVSLEIPHGSDHTFSESSLLSSTPPTLLTPGSVTPLSSSSSVIAPADADSSSKSAVEVTTEPKKETSGLDFELPPMPQIPASGFIPVSNDFLQQLQQIQPSTSPSKSPSLNSSATINNDNPTLSSTPTTTDEVSEPAPSFTDFPRSIPFGVPDYKPEDSYPSTIANDYSLQQQLHQQLQQQQQQQFSLRSLNSSTSSLYNDPSAVSTPERSTPPSPQPFFHRPVSLPITYNPNSVLALDSYSSTPTTYTYSTSVDDETKVTVSDDFLKARLSEDYEPYKKSKALDVAGSRRPSLNGHSSLPSDMGSDEGGSSYGSMKYGSTPSDADQANVPSNPPVTTHYLLDANTLRKVQRNTSCPGCNASISQGLFSTAKLCSYYNTYYCNKCHVGDEAVIPARLVHQLDPKAYPVCSEARGHIHQYYRHPQLNMRVLNPSSYKYSASLEKVFLYSITFKTFVNNLCRLASYAGS